MGDFDTSELKDFAGDLRDAGPKTRRKASGSLTRFTNKVTANARRNAPKDRPWLSTKGIQRDTRTMSRRVYSPPDRTRPATKTGKTEGRNVGLHNETGTEKLPKRPWLVPALAAVEFEFEADLRRIVREAV